MFFLLRENKGLSQFVSRIILLGVSFIILGLLSASMYNFYVDLTMESIRTDSFAISERIGNEIHEMYSKYSEFHKELEEGENMTLSVSTISVPDNIAGRNYNLYFNSSKDHWIDAEIFSTPDISIVDTRRPTARINTEITEYPRAILVYKLYNIEIEVTGEVENPDVLELRYVREKDIEEGIIDTVVIEGL